MNDWKVQIRDHPATLTKELYIFRKDLSGKVEVLQSDLKTVISYDTGAINITPSLKFSADMFQALVDTVQKNYKPSDKSFLEGKLEATEKHLVDMQKLVFKTK